MLKRIFLLLISATFVTLFLCSGCKKEEDNNPNVTGSNCYGNVSITGDLEKSICFNAIDRFEYSPNELDEISVREVETLGPSIYLDINISDFTGYHIYSINDSKNEVELSLNGNNISSFTGFSGTVEVTEYTSSSLNAIISMQCKSSDGKNITINGQIYFTNYSN